MIPDDTETPAAETPPSDEVNRDIPTVAYLLSLTWSPEICRSRAGEADAEVQCRANSFGFNVHGLWPNGPARIHPRYCRDLPPPSLSTLKANLCMTPSPHLLQHEWLAHGTCGWDNPEAYFAKARALRTALNVPDLRPGLGGVMTAGQVRDAFISLNPEIGRDGLDVHVGEGNRLQEVRVCYDLKFAFAPCLSGTGTPDLITIRVTPKP